MIAAKSHRQLYRFEGGLIYVDATGGNQQRLMSMGNFEPKKAAFLRARWRPWHTFVDCGASCGYFTLLAARYLSKGYVHSIEPEMDNVEYLLRAVAKNDYDHVKVHPVALSNYNGHANFYLADDAGQHSLNKVKDKMRRVEVQVTRLDDVLPPRPIDGMKIDVEGVELAVLQGAHRILSGDNEMYIAMDLHPHYHNDNPQIGELLMDHGFRLYDLRTNMNPMPLLRYNCHEVVAVRGS